MSKPTQKTVKKCMTRELTKIIRMTIFLFHHCCFVVHIQAADTHFQSQVILFLLFFTFFKCVSHLLFFHEYTFSLQNCRQFIKVVRKERRVILARSPRIHKKLRLKTSQEPPSTQFPESPALKRPHTQPLHAKKSPVRSVSIDSKRTRGRNRISSTAPPQFVRSTSLLSFSRPPPRSPSRLVFFSQFRR